MNPSSVFLYDNGEDIEKADKSIITGPIHSKNPSWEFSVISSVPVMSTSRPNTALMFFFPSMHCYETRNVTASNLMKLEAFHHGAVKRILDIKEPIMRKNKKQASQI
jgi:hypothetical protein